MPFAARWTTWPTTKPRRSSTRRERLAEWRADAKRACGNQSPQIPLNRELQPVIRQYHLSFELFDDLLKGCEMDLDISRYKILRRWKTIATRSRPSSAC